MTAIEHMIRRISERRPNMLVIGDVILDEYATGAVNRISPEGPFPILDWDTSTFQLGGAANVALNLTSLGCNTALVGVIGKDTYGQKVRELLQKAGIEESGLLELPDRPTTVKTRYGAIGHQILRVDREVRSTVGRNWNDWLKSVLEDGSIDLVVVSDYAKGVMLDEGIPELVVENCTRRGTPVFVDTKRTDVSVFGGATLLKPNRLELANVVGAQLVSLSLDDALVTYRKVAGTKVVAATLGADGIVVFDGERVVHDTSRVKTVFDVTGAGDTVMAALAVSHVVGLSWDECARAGNVAASIVVSRYGTSAVSLEDLKAYEE